MSKNKKALSREARAKRNFYRLVLPAFIIFALVIIVPFFLGFYYSLTDNLWDLKTLQTVYRTHVSNTL